MDKYSYKSVQCTKCLLKSLIDIAYTTPCPNCGTVLNPRPQKPRRHLSEKKAPKLIHKHTVDPPKPKAKVEEKKKPLKKSLKPEKKTLRPKNKDLAPQVKKSKKRKIKRVHHNSPNEVNYIDFYSDDLPSEGYFSDSFEEFYADSPVFGFNPLYYAPNISFRSTFNRGLLNRVSQNLFNLFFDGFAEIEYIPHLSAFQGETETFSIGDLLRNLVAMHPEQATPTDPEVVNRLPSVRVNERVKRESGVCSICQEEFKLGENAKKLKCGHFYHGNCINPWLAAKNTCPVCRETVEL